MKKHIALIAFLILLVVLTGCKKKIASMDVTSSDNAVTNNRYPSFAVETVNASKGDKDVVICVYLKDNPGFLTMAMNIQYDPSVMTLTKVLSGSDFGEYNFIGPKNKQSGCTASWFIPEIPENITDGTILELYFDIMEQAKSGSYPISISRSENGGVVDQNKKEIVFNDATGYIKID